MDRAIKFRAWSTENKKMYPVDEFTCNWNRSFITKTSELVIKSTNILMQFTGLYDCEGKEIYEEAVIEYTQHHFNTTGKRPESPLLVHDSMFEEWMES